MMLHANNTPPSQLEHGLFSCHIAPHKLEIDDGTDAVAG